MSKSDDHYEGALLEELKHTMQLILEGTSALAGVPKRLAAIESKFDALLSEHVSMRVVIKDQSKTLHNHETRLTKLETA